ncbi:hypothetical protein HDZ31DRAFT_48607 [Schizophyllum fasciatum]
MGSEPRDSFYNAFDNTAYAIPSQARPPSPPPGALRGASPSAAYNEPAGPNHERGQSSGDFVGGHSASGSYEPLMASYWRQQDHEADEEAAGSRTLPVPGTSTPPRLTVPSPSTPPPPIPARNPRRMTENGSHGDDEQADDASKYSTDSTDDRLNPARRASQDLRDEADYSRPVLAVRNASVLSSSKEEGE